MKIAIITFQRAHNYGALLQAYALSTVIKNLNHEVAFIDYWPKYRKGMYDIFDLSFMVTKMPFKNKLKRFLRLGFDVFRLKKYFKFNNFIVEKLKVSKEKIFSDFDKIPTDFDKYIYGSDQIWRYNDGAFNKGFDVFYWGGDGVVPKEKKITYAASMGKMNIFNEYKLQIMELIQNFKTISVRETELALLLEQLDGIQRTVVLDPVFLLSPHSWQALISMDRVIPKKPYLLFYQLNESQMARKLAKDISKKYNLDIIEITGNFKPFKNPRIYRSDIGPEDFVSLISKAKFVISTSFHGVAFSIIFEKQFLALGFGGNSSRVSNLLSTLQISDRLVDSLENLPNTEIDYLKVEPILKEQREISLAYLYAELANC